MLELHLWVHASFCMAHRSSGDSRRRLDASKIELEYHFGYLALDCRPLLEVFFLVMRIDDMAVVFLLMADSGQHQSDRTSRSALESWVSAIRKMPCHCSKTERPNNRVPTLMLRSITWLQILRSCR